MKYFNRGIRTTAVLVALISGATSSFVFAESSDLVKLTQQRLSELGYNPGPVDGVLGVKTERAIKRFQNLGGEVGDGRNSSELLAEMHLPCEWEVDNGKGSIRRGGCVNPKEVDDSVMEIDLNQGGSIKFTSPGVFGQ